MNKDNNIMKGQGEDGKWITVNGTHIFVEEGQSVEDAMNSKFENSKNYQESKVKVTLSDDKRKRYNELSEKVISNRAKMKNASPKEREKLISENYRLMTEMDSMWDN